MCVRVLHDVCCLVYALGVLCVFVVCCLLCGAVCFVACVCVVSWCWFLGASWWLLRYVGRWPLAFDLLLVVLLSVV